MAESNPCLELALQAAGDRLSKRDVAKAFRDVDEIREGFVKRGLVDNLDERVAGEVVKRATIAKFEAARTRRNTLLSAQKHGDVMASHREMTANGIEPWEAARAQIEGIQKSGPGTRASAWAAYEATYRRWTRAAWSAMEERPHLKKMVGLKSFDDNLTRELGELRPGGQPGKTGDADAQFLAAKMAGVMELGRTETNQLGASIGRIEGYSGPQDHSELMLMKYGRDEWIKDILPHLDIEGAFPDVAPAKVPEVLSGIYDTIVTGISNEPTGRARGEFVGPANLGRRFEHHRVLHFKSADDYIAYRDKYGNGNTFIGIMRALRRQAKAAGAMEKFGPNPEYEIGRYLGEVQREMKKAGAKPDDIKRLDFDRFKGSVDIMTGLADVPANIRMAEVNSNIRSTQRMAKLGGAMITSVPADFATVAQSGFFRGNGLFRTATQQFEAMIGSNTPEGRQIGALTVEGFDGLIGEVTRASIVNDGMPGLISRMEDKFFQFNFLTQTTDISKRAAARVVTQQLGDGAALPFNKLHPRLQNVLEMHRIGGAEWDVLRAGAFKGESGKMYLTADRAGSLPDDLIAKYAADKLTGVKPEKMAEVLAATRRDLEIRLGGYIVDEVRMGVLDTDYASRRISTWGGSRPGTPAGEAIRHVMLFKGFPIAFAQRVLGRAIWGAPGATTLDRAINNKWHIGTMLAGMTAAGYMAMSIKDMLSGNWPPRDPFSKDTIMAAMMQGGALGIYGDFLFARANRYGGGILGTAAGPVLGSANDFVTIYQNFRDGDPKAAQIINFIYGNTPYANLFYVRPAVDILFMNAMREWASPGYLARKEQRRLDEYGQRQMFPQTLDELTR